MRQVTDEDLHGIGRVGSYDILVDVSGRLVRLLKIFFAKKGGIYVTVPFFRDSRGLLSEVAHDTSSPSATINLAEEGFTTSHLVKYAHYLDGEAHFSQDGKILTKVRRRACRLDAVHGHLFTSYMRGLNAFEEQRNKSKKSAPITLPA